MCNTRDVHVLSEDEGLQEIHLHVTANRRVRGMEFTIAIFTMHSM